jgi:nucleoside-diphosphate-sugar epimerase
MKKVAVLGGTRYVGRRVVERLLDEAPSATGTCRLTTSTVLATNIAACNAYPILCRCSGGRVPSGASPWRYRWVATLVSDHPQQR